MRGWLKQGSQLLLAVMTSVTLTLPSMSYGAEVVKESPTQLEMLGDVVIVRPLLFAGTIIGATVFVITLPFSALGGNVGESAHVLLGEPAKNLFVRCLGCSGEEMEARQKEEAARERAEDAAEAAAEAAEEAAEKAKEEAEAVAEAAEEAADKAKEEAEAAAAAQK